ncbi:3-hydroxyacyl-CoA dehydrogenase [Rhizobium sp. RU36D]|uniref:3-hydroxyacyl-CoA dehydrogenase n=1 Tax=Rhizobium sp. RU36D TaxID=1907415 RepID=UPI0009D8DE14|nr:3-hydroxyacyl-CoA dehydrogenase [Rhizobium sp. RU36D]SMC97799.1 3-hydroxyacyl-CoA dehydrogenase [Rhizobium sp. RU36D]
MSVSLSEPTKIALVGAGAIGSGWAIVFARAGFHAVLNDINQAQLDAAKRLIADRLAELSDFGLLAEPSETVAARLTYDIDLGAAIHGADLVIESAPERLEIKQALLQRLVEGTGPQTVIASSSSAITASAMAEALPDRHRCLVAHPGNPPYLLPVVELVPAPFTAKDIVEKAKTLFTAAGMSVVTLAREVEGFVFNRLQGAVLREAYCLVRDGVVGVDELDAVIRDGLGMRYAFIGPFETSDLNVRGGIAAHAARMAPAYERMGAERGQHDPWTAELVDKVADQRRAALPLSDWEARVAWRDRRLMALNRLKRELREADA